MLGAVGSHLSILGVNVNNDGGTLFILALAVLISCSIIVLIKKEQLKALIIRN